MALVTKRELLQLKQFHYIVELILAFSYILLKAIPYASILDDQLFGTFEFKSGESELLIFTVILIAYKTRRRGHVNFLPYLSSACSMAKCGNFLLFFLYAKRIYSLTYLVILLGHLLLFPKPKYTGPENVTYFLGDDFERERVNNKGVKWIIEFYASWNPDCNEFAGLFSELSAKFSNEKLRFGKIDVSRSPKVAERYNINQSIFTRNLPTLILFSNGRETIRRPLLDNRDRVVPFSFSYENIVSVFNLS